MTATLTIDLRECDTLHGLLSRRLLILVENPSGLAEVEGLTVAELYERLADDLRLMEDIGWASEADQESVALAMPREKLAETLKRLRRDARRAPFSVRHEREPKEGVDERWRRHRPRGDPGLLSWSPSRPADAATSRLRGRRDGCGLYRRPVDPGHRRRLGPSGGQWARGGSWAAGRRPFAAGPSHHLHGALRSRRQHLGSGLPRTLCPQPPRGVRSGYGLRL